MENKGKEPRSGIVKEARDRLDAAWTHDRENREDAASDLKFVAGDQWPDSARRAREAEKRPVLTVNRLPQFIRQTTNDIRQNSPVVKIIPADGSGDKGLAEVYTGLIRQIQYQSSAAHVYASAAEHAAACGIGHYRVTTQYVEDAVFEQEVRLKRITNPLSVYWDPAAVEPDRSDANYCVVTERMPRTTFEESYPEASAVDVEVPSDSSSTDLFWETEDDVLVAEYWRKIPVKRRLVAFEDGTTLDVTDMDEGQLQFMPPVVGERMVDSHKVESYVVTGNEVLSGPHPWAGKFIPIVPVVGSEIPLEKKVVRHGMVRFARDPQQLYNFWRTAAAESIALAPKSPYLVTPEMIGPYKAIWDTANTSNRPYLPYKPDKNAPGVAPQRERPPDPPAALWQEAQIAAEDMQATIGIYDAGLGEKSNETSGKAIMARQREGDTANFHYSDNLAHSLTHTGRILIDLIPKIYDTQRTIRIMGEDDSEDFVEINVATISEDGEPMLLNDLSDGRFDVRVTVGASYATKRIEAADSMMAFAQANPQAAPLIADLIAKNSDWPGADEMAKRLKTLLPPEIKEMETGEDETPPPPPDPMEQKAQAMQMQAAEEDLRAKQLANAKTEAELATIGNDAQGTATEPVDPARLALENEKLRAEIEKIRASAIHELAKADSADGIVGNLMTQQQNNQVPQPGA